MALTTVTKVVGLDDLKLFPITADTSASYTCGSAIDFVGAKKLSVSLNIDSQEITGDNVIIDYWAKAIGAEFSVEFAKQDLALLTTAIGAEVVASGTTPSQKQTLSILDSNQALAFQLQGLILGTDTESSVQSLRIAVMKCKINALDLLDAQERGVSTFTLKGKAMFTNKTFTRNAKTRPLLLDMVMAETAETITAIVA